MAKSVLREKLASGEFVIAPGIQDMISAVVANEVGFDVVYGSGYWLTASAYGLPDAGIASVTQMTDRMATLVETSNGAVIADADTGFGGLLNVHHTVRAYEKAGVTAIQIEDQEFPKKCGHTPYKRLIPVDEMAKKIRVACDARSDKDFLIIARTDARQSEGMDGVKRRMEAYAEAGADILFPEALTSADEMSAMGQGFDKPLLANMASGGITPILSVRELKKMGYALAIFPALASLVSAAAVQNALRHLKDHEDGNCPDVPIFDFKHFCELIGFKDVWEFEQKWGDE